MTARFAGSRCLDERRRRWLASNAGPQLGRSVKAAKQRAAADPAPDEEPVDEQLDLVGYYPLPKLVPSNPWKVLLLLVLITGGLASLLFYGEQAHRGQLETPVEVSEFLDIETGPALHWAGTLSLFVAAQLCLLIGWARSCSPRDFGGNYRVWRWAAMAGFVASFCFATGAHHVFSAVLFHHWKTRFWQQDTIAWLLPAYLIGLGLFWPLHRDMRRCAISTCLLFAAGGGALALVGEHLQLIIWPNTLTATAVLIGSIGCVLCSLLIHARFVIYVSADPPEPRKVTRKSNKSLVGRTLQKRRINNRIKVRRKVELKAKREAEKAERAAEKERKAAEKRELAEERQRQAAEKKAQKKQKKAAPAEAAEATDESVEETKPTPRKTRRTAVKAKAEPKPDLAEEAEPAPEPAPATRSRRKVRAKAKAAEPTPEPEVDDPWAEEEAPRSKSRQKQRSKRQDPEPVELDMDEQEATISMDSGIDPDELKGLSKKQRRALRKQRLEQQRRSA